MAGLSNLLGEEVLKGQDEKVDVMTFAGEGKVVGIYFSAHWCPPCRAFTPQLAEWYKKVKEGPNGSNFDIVFVSSDRDAEKWKEYFDEMPWHAVPYGDRDRKVGAWSWDAGRASGAALGSTLRLPVSVCLCVNWCAYVRVLGLRA